MINKLRIWILVFSALFSIAGIACDIDSIRVTRLTPTAELTPSDGGDEFDVADGIELASTILPLISTVTGADPVLTPTGSPTQLPGEMTATPSPATTPTVTPIPTVVVTVQPTPDSQPTPSRVALPTSTPIN